MNQIIQKIKNFEFLRFDKEIYINELKRQILDDLKEKKELKNHLKINLTIKKFFLIKNKENEEKNNKRKRK